MKNTVSQVDKNWTLSLSPKADAFSATGVVDGHNVWRNQSVVKSAVNLPDSIPATVPGCIHTDLIAAKIIADISVDGREDDQMWIWKTDSKYSTVIKQSQTHRHAILVFHGLDTLASIYINGKLKLSAKNMHRSYEVDISEEIRSADVVLEILFAAPLSDAEAQVEKLGLYPRPYDMPYNYQRKMACSYGWDWGPVTISSGIWKPVVLIQCDDAYLASVAILPSVRNGVPLLTIRPRIIGDSSAQRVKVRVLDNGKEISTYSFDAATTMHEQEVPMAALWQPRGRGDQQLYTVEVSLCTGEEHVQQISKNVGFRTVELDTSAIGSEQFPIKNMFAIKVNGLRLWIRGANWIPDDPFPTRVTKERYEQRIKDMIEVNINGIRVWGGGIYESEDFYNFCDKEGIVVWQDFLFACAAYPETPEMFEEVEREVEEAILRLESHPSLVIYCGGNECIEGFQYWGWQEGLAGRPWGDSFYRKTIPGVLKELDQSRPYIPGSPFSSHSDDVRSFESGTNHIWDVWNELGYERYEQYTPSFAAEFGFNGPGSWAMLTKAIGKETLDSHDLDVANHQKAFDGMSKVAAGLAREFATPPTVGVPWYFAAALGQARAVEIGLKHFRSLYEVCSGAILWQFNDMWPAISWAVLDYTGFRKLAWHAMKAAYQPRTITIGRVDQGAQLTIINDTQNAWVSSAKVSLIDSHGAIVESKEINFELAPFEVARHSLVEAFPRIGNLEYEGFLFADTGDVQAARRSTLKPAAQSPAQDLVISTEFSGSLLKVSVVAKTYIHELAVLPEVMGLGTQVDTQIVSLLPGSRHTFSITGDREILESVKAKIADLLWSHNRVVNNG